jgi:hypothetical protein
MAQRPSLYTRLSPRGLRPVPAGRDAVVVGAQVLALVGLVCATIWIVRATARAWRTELLVESAVEDMTGSKPDVAWKEGPLDQEGHGGKWVLVIEDTSVYVAAS